jgi:glyoxylase-like metal-dependent hydrolase (beta-lactamase superfamily II)
MKLYSINTGNLKLDGGAMFGVVPKVIWSKLYPADENNLCNWSMRCLLVDTGKHKVLIDTGIGTKQSEKFFSNYYLNGDDNLIASLQHNGFSPEDITDVILTHLHFDHAGGAVSWNDDKTGYRTTFPNAIYHISTGHWNWANNPNNREKASFFKENFIPIQESGQLNLIEEEKEIIPGIYARIFNGHTDGQIIPIISFNNKIIAYMADLLPSAAHIPLPYVMSYDTRPLITLDEKAIFMKEAASKNIYLFFEHDLYKEGCTVEETEKGVRLKNTFSLNDYLNT